MRGRLVALLIAGVLACVVAGSSVALGASSSKTSTTFKIVRSAGDVASGCLVQAKATATIVSSGPTETLTIDAQGLPPNTAFDVFVIQVPNAPFGLSSYLGDLRTGNEGSASGQFVGRFSRETFTVAPGVAPAPTIDPSDATSNPAFNPIHQLHLGIWFDSNDDGVAAGCGNAITPFNGEHDAGVQALSTRNFADASGPLGRIHP